MTTLLLDADIVAFQLSATAQRSYQFPGMAEVSVALDEWETMPPRIDEVVQKLCAAMETSEVIVCLSCPTEENFRLDVLPSYKGNRDYSKRPEFLANVKAYLEGEYPSYRRPRLEADDIMGILSTHPTLVKGKRVIVSEDKDMKTIPGWLFNPAKDKKARLVHRDEAEWWHLYQTIVGDTTDGYTGCPKAGPKAAIKALGEWTNTPGPGRNYITSEEGWRRVLEVYAGKGLTEEDALVQARVARILHASDYDFKAKEPILWTPPQTSGSPSRRTSSGPA